MRKIIKAVIYIILIFMAVYQTKNNVNASVIDSKWIKSGDNWKWEKEDGSIATGWLDIDGTTYYFYDSRAFGISDEKYSEGEMVRGLWTFDYGNSWYAFGMLGSLKKSGWYCYRQENMRETWVYATDTGELLTGWQKLNGSWYYFSPDYFGVMACSGSWNINNETYFFLANGKMCKGWCKDTNDNWYYCQDNGVALTGWNKISDNWFYFDDYGRMAQGWTVIDNVRWYFKPSGSLATGWKLIDDNWYFFSQITGLVTGWRYIKGNWYFFDEDGVMQTGWYIDDDGSTYYFGDDGSMKTGTVVIRNRTYHFSGKGILIK